MKLDPGIHIVMHSVFFLKPGVTFEQNPNFDAKGLFLDNAHFPDSVYLI